MASVARSGDVRDNRPPLVAHVVHRLAIGGLENGVVNLINHMPPDLYRHVIVSLTGCTDFRDRIHRKDVPVISLHKREGQDFGLYTRLWRVLRHLRPDIVHTRNLAALESLVVVALDGGPVRVHGEHGRDVYDLDGLNPKYKLLRKAIRPLVHRYISVSNDLANWLVHAIGARADRVTRIYNGVDTVRFHPRAGSRLALGPEGFASAGTFVVGTVGRIEAVKDQMTLVRAFAHLINTGAVAYERLRLVIVGDGPLRGEVEQFLHKATLESVSWLPGEREDIPEIMRSMDLFVLPSLREGISNTILEAMASGLPIVATRVGGNPELVVEGETGKLVPPGDPLALAEAIRTYVNDAELLNLHGAAGRRRVEARFSMETMVNGYLAVYDSVLKDRQRWATDKSSSRSLTV